MISSEIFTDPAKFRHTLLDFKSIEQFLETEKHSDPYRNQLTQLSIEIANYIGKSKALEIRQVLEQLVYLHNEYNGVPNE